MPYDTKSLSKLTNYSFDTVAVAMKVIDIKLVTRVDSGRVIPNTLNEMIGSETRQASIMRRKKSIRKGVYMKNIDYQLQKFTQIDIELELES